MNADLSLMNPADFVLADEFEPPHGMAERLVRRLVDSGLGPVKTKQRRPRRLCRQMSDPEGLLRTLHSRYSGADPQHLGRGRRAGR